MMHLHINNTFNKILPEDASTATNSRQVYNACFSSAIPQIPKAPQLVHANTEVANLLGIENKELSSTDFLNFVTGKEIYPNTKPYAMCYGGHQFGNWAGQLGDGRAINLTEIAHNNTQWAIQLKGSGRTPYSRNADGLAVLRSSIREHLCSEAMHYLGIPTTRSLALSLTGDNVLRDILYNGNPAMEKGAVVARVSPSFIRFGNFEIFASRGDMDSLKKLTEYTISQFYPEIESNTKEGYLAFFKKVCQQTLNTIVNWQRVGFVHGVMNTDNMSILGLTIDYGPYGWLENYDLNWTPNTTDIEHKRYRFGNQPKIASWNLYQLANALYSLIDNEDALQETLDQFNTDYHQKHIDMMRLKLGLLTPIPSDIDLIKKLETVLQLTETDMTIFFRNLSNFSKTQIIKQDISILTTVLDAFYIPEQLNKNILTQWVNWFTSYHERLQLESELDAHRKTAMDTTNPKYVLRNYMAQLIIDDANLGNYDLLSEISELLKNPYKEQENHQKWFAKRPEWARNKTGCSMLSCSS